MAVEFDEIILPTGEQEKPKWATPDFDEIVLPPTEFDEVIPPAPGKAPPTVLERLYQPVVSVGTGLARSVAGSLEAAGYLSNLTGNIDPEFAKLDEELKRRELEKNPLYALGQRMRKHADETSVVHPDLTTTRKYGEIAGQMTGDLAGTGKISGIMKAAGLGATARRLAAPAVQFGAQGGARGIESATEAQASEADLLKSFIAQASIGAGTSVVGPYGKWVERLNQATGGGFWKIVTNAAVEGGANAIQEVTEQMAAAYADKQILDKNHDLYAELVESAKTGGVMGVAASLVISALGGKARPATEERTGAPPIEPILAQIQSDIPRPESVLPDEEIQEVVYPEAQTRDGTPAAQREAEYQAMSEKLDELNKDQFLPEPQRESVTGAGQIARAPDYDPEGIGAREWIRQRVEQGATREQAVAEHSAHIESVRQWEAALPTGTVIKTKYGGIFKKESDGTWRNEKGMVYSGATLGAEVISTPSARPKPQAVARPVQGPMEVPELDAIDAEIARRRAQREAPSVQEPPLAATQEGFQSQESERQAYEDYLREEAESFQSERGDELLDAIQDSGGLPVPGSEMSGPYKGELGNVLEMAKGGRHVGVKGVFTGKLFRKDAPDVDELATRLRDRGFTFETPSDLFDALDQRLRKGKKIYGLAEAQFKRAEGEPELYKVIVNTTKQPGIGVVEGASRIVEASSVEEAIRIARKDRTVRKVISAGLAPPLPRLRARERQGDLLSNQTEDFRLVGEKGVDYAAREREAAERARDQEDARKLQDEQQQTLFQRSVDPRSGKRYSLDDATRSAFTPSTDLATATAVSRLAKAFDASSPSGRASPHHTRLQPVNWPAHLPPNKRVAAAQAIGEAVGTPTVFFRPLTEAPFNGGVLRGERRLFINVNSTVDPVNQVAAHEVTHIMEREAPEIYAEYERAVLEAAADRGEYNRDRLNRNYSPDELTREFVADFTAEAIENPARLQAMLGKNPTLFQRVVGFLRDAIGRITRRVQLAAAKAQKKEISPAASDAISDLRAARRAMEEAWRKWHSQSGGVKEGSREDNPSFSRQMKHDFYAEGQPDEVNKFRNKWRERGVENAVRVSRSANGDYLKPHEIRIPKDQRGKGLGTQFMQELVALADSMGLPIRLSPSVDFGGSSVSRLKEFYKRFGFVENKGRNRDFTHSESMYRDPLSPSSFKRQEAEQSPKEALFIGPKIEGRWHRFFYEGARDVFERTPGLKRLGEAVRKHVDQARKYDGQLVAPYRAWEKRHSLADRKKAFNDFESYWGERERNPQSAAKNLALTGKASQELVELWRQTARFADEHNKGMSVYDDELGYYRPIGSIRDYFPRMPKASLFEILDHGIKDQKEWKRVADMLKEEGKIKHESEAISYLQRALKPERRFDYMGNIEKARKLPLPNKLYDYSFATARRYMKAWAERRAQVEAFGQKLGPNGKDFFDVVREKTIDRSTADYIKAVQDRAYGVVPNTPVHRTAAFLNTLVTPLYLGNIKTMERNVISGLAHNVTTFGFRPALKAALDLKKAWKSIDDAYAKGVLHDDLMNMMADAEQLNSKPLAKLQRGSSRFMSAIGYKFLEDVTRAHGLLTAKSLLRTAIKAYQKNPNSRASLQHRAFMKRNGHSLPNLADENMVGAETDRYLRESVNLAQGGYRYDQVPLFTDSPLGRFLFKFQKWGTQATRNMVRNVLTPMAGTELKINRNGKIQTVNVRSFSPLARYLATTTLVGQAILGLEEELFGTTPGFASIEEIVKTWDEDKQRAVMLALDRSWKGLIAVGGLGIISNYLQQLMDAGERRAAKSPYEPPALGSARALWELALSVKEQGALTVRDIEQFARSQVSMFRTTKALAAEIAPGALPVEKSDHELRWLNSVTRRYSNEVGEGKTSRGPADKGKGKMTPFHEDLRDALMTGDTETAKRLKQEQLQGLNPAQREAFLKSLKASIQAKQPIRVGGTAGAERRALFLEWAKRRLSPEEIARIKALDQTYLKTARAAGLMGTTVKPVDLDDAIRKQKLKQWLKNR